MNTRIAEILGRHSRSIDSGNYEEAEQALLAYFEEVIGEDEVFIDIPVVDHTGKTRSVITGKTYTPHLLAKNQLRAELRRKLDVKNPTDNGN